MTAPDHSIDVFERRHRAKIKDILRRYPPQRQASAVLPLLAMAQEHCGGWLPLAAMDKVAEILDMAPIRVYEVASFHTMFNRNPVGRHHIRVCTSLPCFLRGADRVLDACRHRLNLDVGETSSDHAFTLDRCECLGACVNAPVVWIGDDYYEDVDPDRVDGLLDAFRRAEKPTPGPISGRHASEPEGQKNPSHRARASKKRKHHAG